VHVILQEEVKKARTEAREAAKKKEQDEREALKAHGRAKDISAKAVAKLAPVLTELLPKVKDANNAETDSFKQLPMLMKTQLKGSLEELLAISNIASDCLSGVRTDVEFDYNYVKVAVANGSQLLKSLASQRK